MFFPSFHPRQSLRFPSSSYYLLPPRLLFLSQFSLFYLFQSAVSFSCTYPDLQRCVIFFTSHPAVLTLIRPFWGFFLFAWPVFFLVRLLLLAYSPTVLLISVFVLRGKNLTNTRASSRSLTNIVCQFDRRTPSVATDIFALYLSLRGL